MIDHGQMITALRTRLLTLSVCTTGSVALAATATGYTRSAGSFLTDGFRVGMEVTATGFSANGSDTITAVTATTMTINRARTTESAAAGRTLAVVLPALRGWENIETEPIVGEPHVVEQYVPGPTRLETVGSDGQVAARPMYAIHVHVPANTGNEAAVEYADALIRLFAPGATMTLTNGDVLRVRTDTGPFRGQLHRGDSGWVVVPVTIPCWLYTQNVIA